MVADFAQQLEEKNHAIELLENDKDIVTEEHQQQINTIKEQFDEMTKQTFKDSEEAERRIIELEEELEKSKATEELLQKGSVLDQKK